VKAPRRRYGSAGNTDERFDAYVLADTGRTDRRPQTPLLLDSEATTALRKLCRARKDMVAVRPAITEALHMHPDRDIFTRLPKAGTVRAARLLAEIGAPAAASPPRLPTHGASGSVAETKFDHDPERTQLSPLCVTEC
jgi:transposase